MKTTLFSLIALGVAAAMAAPADRALADEPMVLTDAQLDRVTAGARLDVSVTQTLDDSPGITVLLLLPAKNGQTVDLEKARAGGGPHVKVISGILK